MSVKRLTRMALLTAVALTVFVIEAQIPAPFPLPGMKLGMANIITVYAMFTLGATDTLLILLCRILLGNLLTGQLVSFAYSLCGGVFCYGAMLILRRFLTERQIWICSILSAVAHVVGQLAVAVLITGTFAILYYMPMLTVSAVCAGVFTGACAQLVHNRLRPRQ